MKQEQRRSKLTSQALVLLVTTLQNLKSKAASKQEAKEPF